VNSRVQLKTAAASGGQPPDGQARPLGLAKCDRLDRSATGSERAVADCVFFM